MSASLAKDRLTKRCHMFSASSPGPNAQENLKSWVVLVKLYATGKSRRAII